MYIDINIQLFKLIIQLGNILWSAFLLVISEEIVATCGESVVKINQ